MTSTAPAAWAGVVALMVVGLVRLIAVAAMPPTVTVADDAKPVPVIATVVPPEVGPVGGVTAVTVGAGGAAAYVKVTAPAALDCPATVTMTSADPAAWTGVMAVIDVALVTLTVVAAVPPTVTVAGVAKLVPVIVIDVPPAVVPVAGLTAVTVGGGPTYVNAFAVPVALVSDPTVTVTFTAPAT